jgi:hypothetical protein
MARSRKKTPTRGLTSARSAKQDERLANRKIRRAVKQALAASDELDVLPHRRELTNPWTMAKDGKAWFNTERFPEVLRE